MLFEAIKIIILMSTLFFVALLVSGQDNACKTTNAPSENPLNVSQDLPEFGLRLHLPSALVSDFSKLCSGFRSVSLWHSFFVL